jgi:hypothetical protein
MRWLLIAATLLALALAAAVVLRASGPSSRLAVQPAAASRAGCPDAMLLPTTTAPELAAAPLVAEVARGLELRVDGAPAPDGLSEGTHTLTVTGPGLTPAKLELAVEAFTPVLVEARALEGSASVLVVGARCSSCAQTGAAPALRHDPALRGDVPAAARALAQGDWLRAAEVLRGVPPAAREHPDVIRLLAVLHALSGHVSLSRAEVALLPSADAARAALVRRDALADLKGSRQRQTSVARWNAATDRFQRLTDAFVADAPELVTSLTRRFVALSTDFARAFDASDALASEIAVDTANAAVAEAVRTLRARHASDCAWQARITSTL